MIFLNIIHISPPHTTLGKCNFVLYACLIFAIHVDLLAFEFRRACIYSVVNLIHKKGPQAIRSHNHKQNYTIYIGLERL